MGFCIKCGQTLAEGAHFCSNCGVAVGETNTGTSQRKTVYDGELYKCPNCAERLDSFKSFCPTCGYELRGTKGASVVKEFSEKLEQIENTREEQKSNFFTGILNALEDERLNKADERKINFIRSFSIPNTKEDIFEFMILAGSNIEIDLSGTEGRVGNSPQRAVSDAWLAKFEQAYEKARFSFSDSPDFIKIKELYEKKMFQLEKEKRRKKNNDRMVLIGLIAIPVGCLILLLIQQFFSH